MANKNKKKNVRHSKLESINKLSYSQLQKAFKNLHREAVDTFKKLASNKIIFSHLEAEKNMEALKKFIINIQKIRMRMKNLHGSVVKLFTFGKRR